LNHETPPSEPREPSRRTLITWLVVWLWRLPVIAVLGGGIYGVLRAYRIQFGKVQPSPEPGFDERPPQLVAPLAAFAMPWDVVEFSFDGTPAIAVRLPEPVPGGLSVNGQHFIAFSRVCTHLGCITAFNQDEEVIAVAFNYRTSDPALVCHCHLSVFLPARAGMAVSGPAVEPLPRIRLELRDDVLYAVGLEQPLGS
jgi:arsenite oxidase small subunit